MPYSEVLYSAVFTRCYMDFVMCRYLQIAQHIVIALNLLSLAAVVVLEMFLATELWTFRIVFLMLL